MDARTHARRRTGDRRTCKDSGVSRSRESLCVESLASHAAAAAESARLVRGASRCPQPGHCKHHRGGVSWWIRARRGGRGTGTSTRRACSWRAWWPPRPRPPAGSATAPRRRTARTAPRTSWAPALPCTGCTRSTCPGSSAGSTPAAPSPLPTPPSHHRRPAERRSKQVKKHGDRAKGIEEARDRMGAPRARRTYRQGRSRRLKPCREAAGGLEDRAEKGEQEHGAREGDARGRPHGRRWLARATRAECSCSHAHSLTDSRPPSQWAICDDPSSACGQKR
jgi:hypothetical protein